MAGLGDISGLTFEQRVERAGEIKTRLEMTFAKRPSSEWERELLELDVPAIIVRDLDEALELPHFQSRGSVAEIGRLRYIAQPMKFSTGNPSSRRAPPPALDEHRNAILAELGYTA